MAPRTHAVRVRIREVTYAVTEQDILGNDTVGYRTAYGPGRPEIDPATVLGPEADPETDEFKEAVLNFKLGERIELLDQDYVRLMNGDAVLDAEDVEESAIEVDDEEIMDIRTASVDDLARWIKQERPSVNDVVQASNGEAELAQKLLEAEQQAQDGEPRKGVIDGLSVVVGRG